MTPIDRLRVMFSIQDIPSNLVDTISQKNRVLLDMALVTVSFTQVEQGRLLEQLMTSSLSRMVRNAFRDSLAHERDLLVQLASAGSTTSFVKMLLANARGMKSISGVIKTLLGEKAVFHPAFLTRAIAARCIKRMAWPLDVDACDITDGQRRLLTFVYGERFLSGMQGVATVTPIALGRKAGTSLESRNVYPTVEEHP